MPGKVFTRSQYPMPLESGAGSTSVMAMRNQIADNTAVIHQRVLILNQYPEPLESGLGSTPVMPSKGYVAENTAMLNSPAFILEQTPSALPNRIGEEDMPGGFRQQAILTGQSSPLADLGRGIVQIDGVKVLFDARA